MMSAEPTEMTTATFVDHPALRRLYAYWDGKRAGKRMAARTDIDPLEMGAPLLPHLMLCDLLDGGTRSRFRLVGTGIVGRYGQDPTGQFLEPRSSQGYFAALREFNQLAARERAPIYGECSFRWEHQRSLRARHLVLPLTTQGRDAAMVLVGAVFESGDVFPPQIAMLERMVDEMAVVRRVMPPELGVEIVAPLSISAA